MTAPHSFEVLLDRQDNKPAETVGDDATLLKGVTLSPDELVENETLLALDGTLGCSLGEVLDCN